MIGKFNFDFTGATITPINDSNGKPTKYEIIPPTGSGVPTKVEIDLGEVCKFDVYFFHTAHGSNSPDRDAPSPNDISDADYGCNMGYNDFTTFSFSHKFSSFGNPQTKTVISKHKDDKNYCEFSVDMEEGEGCNDLRYCATGCNDLRYCATGSSCDINYFANSDGSSMVNGNNNGSLVPSKTITSIKVTCPSSPPISYSYTNFTPTFDETTNILTFTPNDGTTGTQSLGVSNTTSVATNITDIDKWNGEFDMNFVCGNDVKLHTGWGEITFEECNVGNGIY
jgi:hypothetical protein